jgi:hypothetical protein
VFGRTITFLKCTNLRTGWYSLESSTGRHSASPSALLATIFFRYLHSEHMFWVNIQHEMRLFMLRALYLADRQSCLLHSSIAVSLRAWRKQLMRTVRNTWAVRNCAYSFLYPFLADDCLKFISGPSNTPYWSILSWKRPLELNSRRILFYFHSTAVSATFPFHRIGDFTAKHSTTLHPMRQPKLTYNVGSFCRGKK